MTYLVPIGLSAAAESIDSISRDTVAVSSCHPVTVLAEEARHNFKIFEGSGTNILYTLPPLRMAHQQGIC